MAYKRKTWKDRLVEYPGRRTLTRVSGSTDVMVVDVSRSEGNISQVGDAFSSENMNDLEGRIEDEFDNALKVYTEISVAADVWSSYTAQLEYERQIISDYKYKADIALTGITAQHCVHVSFAPEEVRDGVFAPYNNSQDGYVRIYAKSKPISTIIIPTIYAVSKGV